MLELFSNHFVSNVYFSIAHSWSGRHRESLGGGADGAQPGGMAAADSREGQSTDRERGHRSAQQKAQETGSNNSEHS